MKQEDKEILLVDLCARLPYGVIVDYGYNAFDIHKGNYVKHGSKCILKCYLLDVFMSPRQDEKGEYIKPYLRPMSSMTEEEKREYVSFIGGQKPFDSDFSIYPKEHRFVYEWDVANYVKWLNSHHFDYHGLIPLGLAIEVTEENNPYKE